MDRIGRGQLLQPVITHLQHLSEGTDRFTVRNWTPQ